MSEQPVQNQPRNLIELFSVLREENVPETEYRDYMVRFLEANAREKHIPIHGTFELTPLCNLDCKMCYVHLSTEQFNPRKLLAVDTWKRIIMQARKAGMINANLTGGECLTYPGFDDVYLFLRDHGIVTCVLTNGVLLDAERIAFFKRYPPRLLQLTLYGSSEDTYERVTGRRVFGQLVNQLYAAKEAGLPISLTYTPNAFVQDNYLDLLKLTQDLGFPFHINSKLFSPRENTGRGKHDLALESYMELYRIQREMYHEILTETDPAELPDEGISGDTRFGLRCSGGRSSFAVHYDGRMSPCASFYELSVDALSLGFEALPVECGGCVYKDWCLPCMAMHKDAPAGHCDRQICQRTKMLISMGFIPMPGKGGASLP